MLKLLGAVFTVSGLGLLGIKMSNEIKEKTELAKGFKNGFLYIRSEISLSYNLLFDGIKKAADFAGSAKQYFDKCHNLMKKESVTFKECWEKAILDIEDKKLYEILRELGKRLGQSNVETELSVIDDINVKLDLYISGQEKRLVTEGQIYKKAGFILGIAVVILMI